MISINEIYHPIPDIKYLYHWVQDESTKDYVLQNGITTDSEGYVYLSEKPLSDTHPSWKNKGYIFKVTIPDINLLYDWRDFWYNDNDEEIDSDHQYDKDNPYYIYMGDIPKEYCKLI